MGVSSDGMLYFGFLVAEEDVELPKWMEGYDYFDYFVLEKAGVSKEAPYEERSRVIEACPAELQTFCSYDYPMYVLAVRGVSKIVSRGKSLEITADDLQVPQQKIDEFKKWCEASGIKYEEPKWLLCSMLG